MKNTRIRKYAKYNYKFNNYMTTQQYKISIVEKNQAHILLSDQEDACECVELPEDNRALQIFGEYGKNMMYFCNYCDCDIVGKLYSCNIKLDQIKNNAYPVYFMRIKYMKKQLSGNLFDIYLFFTANNEKAFITTPEISATGFFSTYIVPDDDNLLFLLDENIKLFMFNKYKDIYIVSENKKECMQMIIKHINDFKTTIQQLLVPKKYMDDCNISNMIKSMLSIIETDHFKDLLSIYLTYRDDMRRQKYDVREYIPSDKTIRMSDIVNNKTILDDICDVEFDDV